MACGTPIRWCTGDRICETAGADNFDIAKNLLAKREDEVWSEHLYGWPVSRAAYLPSLLTLTLVKKSDAIISREILLLSFTGEGTISAPAPAPATPRSSVRMFNSSSGQGTCRAARVDVEVHRPRVFQSGVVSREGTKPMTIRNSDVLGGKSGGNQKFNRTTLAATGCLRPNQSMDSLNNVYRRPARPEGIRGYLQSAS
jgi:hypothetical protein